MCKGPPVWPSSSGLALEDGVWCLPKQHGTSESKSARRAQGGDKHRRGAVCRAWNSRSGDPPPPPAAGRARTAARCGSVVRCGLACVVLAVPRLHEILELLLDLEVNLCGRCLDVENLPPVFTVLPPDTQNMRRTELNVAIITGAILIDVETGAAPAPRPPVPIEVVHGDQRRLQLVVRLIGRCRADLHRASAR
eukprot:scaffold42696_cov57-Phaeocystis_antarctica.AAC.2